MRVYADSSALLKRIGDEAESEALVSALREHGQGGDVLAASSLAWIEVSRAVRASPRPAVVERADELVDAAMSGVLERPMAAEVLALARRVAPTVLRSLDAIHLASAILLDADLLLAYDRRLVEAARHHGLATSSPT